MSWSEEETIEILEGRGPRILDVDESSREEREVNRTWSAIRTAGEKGFVSTEASVRGFLNSSRPELRIEALNSLCRWGTSDHRELVWARAQDLSLSDVERGFAVEALLLSPDPKTSDDLRRLMDLLDDTDPLVQSKVRRVADRWDSRPTS